MTDTLLDWARCLGIRILLCREFDCCVMGSFIRSIRSATGITPWTSGLDHRDVLVRHVNDLLASCDLSMFSGRVQR
jgi:hypothetical protein